MVSQQVTKETIFRQLDQLPPNRLMEVAQFIEFLQSRTQQPARRKSLRKHSAFGIWADYNCTLYRISEDNKIEVSKLLLNTFARPLLLLLSESKDKLFILYDFDVSVELLVFDIDSIRTKEIPKELDNIVEVSKWNVRRATETEVNYLKNYIINAGIMDLRNLSNSTLDFGFYRYYLTKNQLLNVINRIRLGLKEQEG